MAAETVNVDGNKVTFKGDLFIESWPFEASELQLRDGEGTALGDTFDGYTIVRKWTDGHGRSRASLLKQTNQFPTLEKTVEVTVG